MSKPEDAMGDSRRPPRDEPPAPRGLKREPRRKSKKERPASKGRVHKGRTRS